MIARTCLYCTKEFKTYHYLIRQGYGKFCSMSCRESFRWSDENNRIAASVRQKQRFKDNPDELERMRDRTTDLWKDSGYRKNMLAIRQSNEYKSKISNTLKSNWQNMTKTEVENRLKNIFYSYVPNSYESFLLKALDCLFPNEYKLNVNADVVIGRKIPDFINVNGKKKLIELFGDRRFKTEKDEVDKRTHYRKYRFDMLVIWDNDLSNIDKLKHKLTTFHNKTK